MQIKKLIFLTTVSILTMLSAFSFPQGLQLSEYEKLWLKKHKDSLLFSVECKFPPFIFVEKDSIPKGLSIDMTKEIEKILGLKFIYQKCADLPEIIQQVRDDKTDLISSVKNIPERKSYMLFSETFIEIPTIIVTLNGINNKLLLKDLSNYKIAVGAETSLFYYIKESYPSYNVITFNSEFECLENLVLGKTDVVLTDAASFSNFKIKYLVDNLKVTSVIPFSYNLAYGAPLKNDTLIQIINKAITQISIERKEEILNKWINIDINKNFNLKKIITLTASIFILILMVLVIVSVWNSMLNKKIIEKTKQLREELHLRKKTEENLLQTNKELINAKERAEESDHLKSAFLANLSHEIRTPMNGILGFTRLLGKSDLSSENKSKYIDIVNSSGNYLLSIINDIIEVSQLETNQVSINKENTNVNDLCKELISELKITIPANKNIELIYDDLLPEDQSLIETDKIKLKQILVNLILNAIKYSPSGKICYGYEHVKQDTLRFYVKDTGIGIKKDHQLLIFNRFRQIDTNEQIFQSGSGLGLSITKSYVELLGGKIWVESELGKGSQFYFTIPNIKASLAQNAIPSVISQVLQKKIPQTILVAEDDEINHEYIKEILSDIKINLIQTRNGVEAVNACKKNASINLVLMDIKMPIMDGYEAMKKIKHLRPEIIVIAQTAYALRDDKTKIMEAGFDGYISKPMDKEKLIKLITSME